MRHFLFIFCLFTLSCFSWAADLDYHGYLRTPVGMNQQSGKEVTINNPGSSGNEFRLGNETPYAEATFVADFIHRDKNQKKSSEFFNSTLTFAFSPPFNSQYGDTSSNGDYIQVVEAYIAGGFVEGFPASVWAGKRFYREPQIHMNDFYYFGDMSGAGGGVENIALGSGTLAVALLQYSNRSVTNSMTGTPSKQALDVRWKEVAFGSSDFFEFWIAEAYSGPGSGLDSTPSPVSYSASTGTALGVKWRHQLVDGNNEAAIIYGTGIMENLSLNSDAYSTTSGNGNLTNTNHSRFVESFVEELGPKYAVQAVLIADFLNRSSGTNSRWLSAGVRPVYYFSDHFHLNAQLGYSVVTDSSETITGGAAAGDRALLRATISPELAIGHGVYNRPVIRAYLSQTSWNSANGDLSNKGSLVYNSDSSLRGQLNQTEIGFEGEVWF